MVRAFCSYCRRLGAQAGLAAFVRDGAFCRYAPNRLRFSQYGESFLLLLQAARRASRPRRFVTRWCFLLLRSKPLESVIALSFLLRLLQATPSQHAKTVRRVPRCSPHSRDFAGGVRFRKRL